MLKTCKKCKKEKPADDFSFSSAHTDNKNPNCHDCQKKINNRSAKRSNKIEWTLDDEF